MTPPETFVWIGQPDPEMQDGCHVWRGPAENGRESVVRLECLGPADCDACRSPAGRLPLRIEASP